MLVLKDVIRTVY